ncbi:MAG: transglutaminase-like domain-containing protein [Verrucomicrobiales bacterium]|jgi:regulator of sirC expression with transglutaminase-like and TPR domain|nr:transglutaminase-like domain-containing protein [Verrucomicrobiales bacterium]
MFDQIQKRALESLLAEDDPKTKQLVVDQLCANPAEKYQSVMQEFSRSANDRVRECALEILSRWGCGTSRMELFLRAIRQNPWESWEDLERFSWDLCEFERGRFDKKTYSTCLDEWAARVQRIVPADANATRRILALRQVLGQEEGFRGNVDDYYHPDNSYLDTVIDDRRGLPLTVTLVYVFVGRRLGWDVCGIGVPSHYIGGLDRVLFDPFHGGVLIDEAQTLAHFKIHNPECDCLHLFKSTPYETAKRIMANLLKAYALVEDEERCKRINQALEELLAARK